MIRWSRNTKVKPTEEICGSFPHLGMFTAVKTKEYDCYVDFYLPTMQMSQIPTCHLISSPHWVEAPQTELCYLYFLLCACVRAKLTNCLLH